VKWLQLERGTAVGDGTCPSVVLRRRAQFEHERDHDRLLTHVLARTLVDEARRLQSQGAFQTSSQSACEHAMLRLPQLSGLAGLSGEEGW